MIGATTRLTRTLRASFEGLRSSPTRQWWTTFLLVSALGGLWGLANPLFSGPDEPAHVVRSAAIARGQLTGEERSGETGAGLYVEVPSIYNDPRLTCFAFFADVPASCQSFDGPERDGQVRTTAARHPPAYYFVVGVLTRWYPVGSASVYLMRLVGVLTTGALLATAVVALGRTRAPRIALAGLGLAVTPMVLFVAGTVNPSAFEIPAAMALWVCGAILLSDPRHKHSTWLVTAVGVSGVVLALSRQLAPLWMALIAILLVARSRPRDVVSLFRATSVRIWSAVVAACALVQLLWVVIVKPLDANLAGNERLDLEGAEVARQTLGASFGRYREMIGAFGWLDTPAPAGTILLWTLGLGVVGLLALAVARRRDALVLLALVALVIVVPVVLEFAGYRDAGGFFWQGRYTLPLAVGVPILAGFSLAETKAEVLRGTRLAAALGVMLVVAHVLAYAQNLRRYTVGYDGRILFWQHPAWSPPVTSWLLLLAFVVTVTAFYVWLLAGVPTPSPSHAGAGSDGNE